MRAVLDEALRVATAPGYLRVARKDTVLGAGPDQAGAVGPGGAASYDLTAGNDYQLRISEAITLKPRGFRLGLSKRAASSRVAQVDTEPARLSA